MDSSPKEEEEAEGEAAEENHDNEVDVNCTTAAALLPPYLLYNDRLPTTDGIQ
jgi:hypothetical protein